jgi:hypothetical protein
MNFIFKKLESVENEKINVAAPSTSNDWYSMEDLQNIKRLNDMNLLDEDKLSVAFEHYSSPKIKRQISRARSDEKIFNKKKSVIIIYLERLNF